MFFLVMVDGDFFYWFLLYKWFSKWVSSWFLTEASGVIKRGLLLAHPRSWSNFPANEASSYLNVGIFQQVTFDDTGV
jgi:hypothetical protein